MACDDQSLREWYESYMAADGNALREHSPLVQAVKSDDLDTDAIEQRICDLVQIVYVTEGFCARCHYMFDNWPLQSYTVSCSSESSDSLDSEDEEDLEYSEETEETEETEEKEHGQLPWKHARVGLYHTLEIEAAARSRCKFCAFLLQMLKDDRMLQTFRQIESRLDQLGEQSTISLSIHHRGGEDLLWYNMPNKLASSGGSNIFDCFTLPKLVNYADEDLGIFDKANRWLRTCSESHERCNAPTNAHLPTRLVSIAGGQPRLVITATLGTPIEPLRYATLSYCWGQLPFLKLTSFNLENFMKEIPTEDLPQTVTDAFEIAASLAIDYIWIDSLCIVQNDKDDWRQEADLMQSVYSGSYVNIAAASSRDAYGGCLGLRTPYFSGGVRVNVRTNNSQEGKQFLRNNIYEISVLMTHLMTRGWVIQEKVLAPRTLSFGDRGVFWECRQGLACEYLQDGFESGRDSHLVFGSEYWTEQFWGEMVSSYSAASLTVPSDKLPALSGMARAVFNVTGDEYLAGLWRRNIEMHLCWHKFGFPSTRKRPECGSQDWIAPSWSWASIDKRVNCPNYQDGPHLDGSRLDRYAHINKTEMTFSGAEPYGQLSRGVLYIRCSAIVAGRLCSPEVSHSLLHEPDDDDGYVEAEDDDEDGDDVEECVSIDSSDGEKLFSVSIDCIDDGWRHNKEMVYLLPLAHVYTGWVGNIQGQMIRNWQRVGIVLRKTPGIAGEFCRIGRFSFHDYIYWKSTETETQLETFLRVLDESSQETAREVCAEVVDNPEFPDEKYVITLV
ncbi:uncharacterized protein PG998_011666 [Apiospora kogelbergensis]|uniref:uncharacterized protein n=1 Tax=Apiospora kogelbergensis TaxID=1337665 RepID=UPI0031307529